MYENYKFWGPYKAKDGRLRLIGKDEHGKKHTISYPKYLMECHLGRFLQEDEQIDHIDGNPLNNDLNNLQILKRGIHQKNDVLRNRDIEVRCTYCNKLFKIAGNKVSDRNRRDRHSSGYFCSRKCSGKYGKEIELGLREHIQKEKIIPVKYKVKSAQEETPEVEAG